MHRCTLCTKEILDDEGSLSDIKRRHYHLSCLRAALSELDKWGIEMMRHFASHTIAIGPFK